MPISQKLLKELAEGYYPEAGSHGWGHIEDVMSNAKKMLKAKHEQMTPEAQAAVMFHDSGLYPNGLDNPEVRGGHESRGARVARKALQRYFTKDQLRLIAAAIREHRGSYKGEYTSPLSELVSSADRGAPDIGKKIMRSYNYGLEHGWNQARAVRNVIDQLSKKYGRQGYARYPSYYRALYAKELKDFQRTADSLTPEQVLEHVAKYSK